MARAALILVKVFGVLFILAVAAVSIVCSCLFGFLRSGGLLAAAGAGALWLALAR